MKWFLGLILSLASLDAVAGAIPFPSCTINNQPVRYVSAPSDYKNSYYARGGYVYIAESGFVDGYPVISYNPAFLSQKPKEWNLQVMLHECAHLKIHAIPNRHPPTKEYEADCHSANRMKSEYGYKNEDFDIVIETMKEVLPQDRITAFKTCLNY